MSGSAIASDPAIDLLAAALADEYLDVRLSAKPIEDRQPRKGRQKHPTHRWVSVAAAYELKSPDHIEATSSMLGEDGKWVQVMMAQIKRNKGACDGAIRRAATSDAFPGRRRAASQLEYSIPVSRC